MPDASDSHDFRELFQAHAPFVWRVLRRHGVVERDLEDACQEVFLVVHRRRADFEGRSQLRSWMYGIAVRVGLGFRRKAYRRLERPSDQLPEAQVGASQLDQAEQGQLLRMVDEVLDNLSPAKREAFALYELEGMTMAEVAATLGIPEGTALNRYYAAREQIRASLARRTGDPRVLLTRRSLSREAP